MLAVGIGDGVDQQIRVVLDVVISPHHLVTSNLLRRQDRLLNRGQGADLTELRQLHVLQALSILGQADMAHAALNVVDEPALAVHGHDGDALAGDVSAVLKDLGA